MKIPPALTSLRETRNIDLIVKLTHDRLCYRWRGVPFNTPLKVLICDMKHLLVTSRAGGKVWEIRWDDVQVLV